MTGTVGTLRDGYSLFPLRACAHVGKQAGTHYPSLASLSVGFDR